MACTDKCCGVCDEYQSAGTAPEYKRFYDKKSNVCSKCIKQKVLERVTIDELTLYKTFNYKTNITKGFTHFYNPSTGLLWRCHNSGLDHTEQNLCNRKLRFSKVSPRYYEVTGKRILHEGLFSAGGIFCYDKRRLRRTLRKLGVVGKIERLIS